MTERCRKGGKTIPLRRLALNFSTAIRPFTPKFQPNFQRQLGATEDSMWLAIWGRIIGGRMFISVA
jgi:hypothetical protein